MLRLLTQGLGSPQLITQGLSTAVSAPPPLTWQPGGLYGGDLADVPAGACVLLVLDGSLYVADQSDGDSLPNDVPWPSVSWWTQITGTPPTSVV